MLITTSTKEMMKKDIKAVCRVSAKARMESKPEETSKPNNRSKDAGNHFHIQTTGKGVYLPNWVILRPGLSQYIKKYIIKFDQ